MQKKKIVFVINNFLVGGVERLLLDLLSHLDKNRFEIEIITVLGSGPLEKDFRSLGLPIYFAYSSNSALPKKLPFKLYWILIAPFTLLRLIIFLIKIKSDVVITSLWQADILGMIASRFCRIKERIIIQHDVHRLSFSRRLFKKFFAFCQTTHVIANSETVRKFLINYWKIPPRKVVVIHNGIDIRRFKNGRKETNISNLVIGMIGRLEPIKGPLHLLEALKILKDKFSLEPSTIFIGEGSLRQNLKKYTKENNLKNVQFIGFVSDIISSLKEIDILVVPSLEEGFGLVALEGLVSYKIIIASDLPAIRELITNGQDGLLFKVGQSRELVLALRKVLTDQSFFEYLKDNTKTWVKERGVSFDARTIAHRYEMFINECLITRKRREMLK